MCKERSQVGLWEVNEQAEGHGDRGNTKVLNRPLDILLWGKDSCENKPELQRNWLCGVVPKTEGEPGVCPPASCGERREARRRDLQLITFPGKQMGKAQTEGYDFPEGCG